MSQKRKHEMRPMHETVRLVGTVGHEVVKKKLIECMQFVKQENARSFPALVRLG